MKRISNGMVNAVKERFNSASVGHFSSSLSTIIIENVMQIASVIPVVRFDTIINEVMVVTNKSSNCLTNKYINIDS